MGRGGPQPAYQVRPGDLQLDGAAADLEDPDATPIVSQPMNNDASVSPETVDEVDDDNNNWNVLPKDVDDEEKRVDEVVDGSGLTASCRDVDEEKRGVDERMDDMELVSSCNQTDINNSCLEQETSASSRSQSLPCVGNKPMIELRDLYWLLETNMKMSQRCYQVEDTSLNKTNNNSEHSEDDSKESNEFGNKIVDMQNGKEEEEEKVLEIEIQCQYPNSVRYYSKMEDVKESIDLEIPMKTILKETKDTEIQTRRRVERKVTINLMPIQNLSSETLDLSEVQIENLELTKEKQTDLDTFIENIEGKDFKNMESYTQPDYQKTDSPTRNPKLATSEGMKKNKAEDKCRVSKASDVSRDRKGDNFAGEWEAKMSGQEKLAAKIDVMDFVHPGEIDDDTRGEYDSLTTSSNPEDVDHTTVADFGSQLNSYLGSWNEEKDGNYSFKENATLTEQEIGDPICSEGDGSVNQLNSLASLSHDEEKQNVMAASDDTANIGTTAKKRKDSKENLNTKMSMMNSKEKPAVVDGDSSVACSSDDKGDLINSPGVFPTATVFTASSEYDVGTFFLQHQSLDMFDLHKVQAGSASHAALHVMGALDTKSEYECGQLLDNAFKGELEKTLLTDRFSRVVTKPPCGTQRRRSRSRSRASRDSRQSEAEIVSTSHHQNVDKESLQSRSQMEGLKKNISCASSTGDATFMSCSLQVSSSKFMAPTNPKAVSVSSESQKGKVSSEQDQKLSTSRGFPSKALPIAGTITEESSLEDSPLSQNSPTHAGKAAQLSQGNFTDGKKERKENTSVAHQNEMIQKGSCLQTNRKGYVGLLSEMKTCRFSKVSGFKRHESIGVQLSSETTDLAQISSLDRGSEDGTDGCTKDGTLKNVSSLLVSGISREGKSASTLNTTMDSLSLKQRSETALSQSDHGNVVAKRSDRFKQVHGRKRLAKQPFENNLLEQSGSCDLTSCEQSDKGNISGKILNESVDVPSSHPTSNVQIAERQATIGSWILRGDGERSETDASVASSLVGSKAGHSAYKNPRCSHSEYTLSPSLHYSSDVIDVKTSRSIGSNLVQIGEGKTSSSVQCIGVQCSPVGTSQRGLQHFLFSYENVQEDSERVLTEFQRDVFLSDNTITPSTHHSFARAETNLSNLRDLTISNADTQSKLAPTRQKSMDDKMSVGIQTTLVSYEDSSDFTTSKTTFSSGNRNKFCDIEKRPSNPTPAFTCNQIILSADKQCSSIAIQCSFDQQLVSQTFSENQIFDLEKSSASTTISSVYLDRQSMFGNSLSGSIHHSSKAILENSTNPSAGPFVSAGNQCDFPSLELSNVGLKTRDKVSHSQDEKPDVGLEVCTQTTTFPSESRHRLSKADSISTPSYHYSSINDDVATTRKTGDSVWKGVCVSKGNQCHPLKIQYENTMENSAADIGAKNQMFYSSSSYYSDSATRWLSRKRSRSLESVISRSIQCQSLGLSSAASKRSSVRTRSDHELFRQSHTSELYVQSASIQVGTKLPLDVSTLEYVTMVSDSVQNERLSSKSPTFTHRTRGVEDTCGLSTLQEGTLSESLADIDSVARMTNRDVPSLPGAYSDDVGSHPIRPYLRHGAGSGLFQSHINDDICNVIRDTRMMTGDNERRRFASTRLLPPIQASTHKLMTDSIPYPGTFLDQDYISDQHSRSSFKNEAQTESKARSRQRKLSSTVSFMEPPVVDESQTLTSQDSADDVQNVGARPKSFQAVVQQQYSSQQFDTHESQLFMRHNQPLPGIQPASIPREGYEDPLLTSFRRAQAHQMVNKEDRRQPTPTQHESTEGESEIKSTLDTAVPPSSQYRKDFLSRPSANLRTLPNRLEDIGVLACLDNSWLLAEASARPVRPDENYFFDSDLSHSVDAMTPQSKNRFIHRNSQEDEGVLSKKWLSIDGSGDVYITTGSEISDRPSDLKTESKTRSEIQEGADEEKFESVKSKESVVVREAEPASTEKEETDVKETKSVEREKNLSQATLDLPSIEDVSQAAVRADSDGVESSQAETETKAGGDKPRKQRERDIKTRRKGPGKRGPSGGNDGEPPKKLQRKKLDRPSLFPGRVLAESHYYPTSNVISVLVKPVNVDVNKDNLNMQVQIHRRQPPPTTLPSLKVNSQQRAKQLARRMVFGRRQLGLKCPPMLTRNIIDLRAANPPFNTSVDPEVTRRYEWMHRNHSYL